MKVLLLNASPKSTGATQEILSIVNSQIPSAVTTKIVCLGDLNIQYCKGCKTCYNTCQCTINDDMISLINQLDEADIVVIAAPSYWGDVPGQFKVFIDRCTVYSETNPNPNHKTLKPDKKCYAIALRTGTRPIECEHIIKTIAHWCGHMKIDMADSMFFCEINDKEDIVSRKGDILKKTEKWFNQ